jgi:hypothetical protein
MLLLIFVILSLFLSSTRVCNLFLSVSRNISVCINVLSFVVFVINVSLLRDTGLSTDTEIRVPV